VSIIIAPAVFDSSVNRISEDGVFTFQLSGSLSEGVHILGSISDDTLACAYTSGSFSVLTSTFSPGSSSGREVTLVSLDFSLEGNHSRVNIGVREILELNIGGSVPRIRGVDTDIFTARVSTVIIGVGTANITINSDSQSFALELNVNLVPLIHGEGGARITTIVSLSRTALSNVHFGGVTEEPDAGDSA